MCTIIPWGMVITIIIIIISIIIIGYPFSFERFFSYNTSQCLMIRSSVICTSEKLRLWGTDFLRLCGANAKNHSINKPLHTTWGESYRWVSQTLLGFGRRTNVNLELMHPVGYHGDEWGVSVQRGDAMGVFAKFGNTLHIPTGHQLLNSRRHLLILGKLQLYLHNSVREVNGMGVITRKPSVMT